MGKENTLMMMHLPADLHASIRQKIDSGRHRDEAEVIRQALVALEARDEERLERLRTLVAEGIAAVERGEVVEWTPELMDEIEREAEEMDRRGELPDPDVCP